MNKKFIIQVKTILKTALLHKGNLLWEDYPDNRHVGAGQFGDLRASYLMFHFNQSPVRFVEFTYAHQRNRKTYGYRFRNEEIDIQERKLREDKFNNLFEDKLISDFLQKYDFITLLSELVYDKFDILT